MLHSIVVWKTPQYRLIVFPKPADRRVQRYTPDDIYCRAAPELNCTPVQPPPRNAISHIHPCRDARLVRPQPQTAPEPGSITTLAQGRTDRAYLQPVRGLRHHIGSQPPHPPRLLLLQAWRWETTDNPLWPGSKYYSLTSVDSRLDRSLVYLDDSHQRDVVALYEFNFSLADKFESFTTGKFTLHAYFKAISLLATPFFSPRLM